MSALSSKGHVVCPACIVYYIFLYCFYNTPTVENHFLYDNNKLYLYCNVTDPATHTHWLYIYL